MNDFFRDLKSPSWWLGVVVLSLLLNLAAAYVKPLIDGFLARMSDRKLRKLESTKADLERQAEILRVLRIASSCSRWTRSNFFWVLFYPPAFVLRFWSLPLCGSKQFHR